RPPVWYPMADKAAWPARISGQNAGNRNERTISSSRTVSAKLGHAPITMYFIIARWSQKGDNQSSKFIACKATHPIHVDESDESPDNGSACPARSLPWPGAIALFCRPKGWIDLFVSPLPEGGSETSHGIPFQPGSVVLPWQDRGDFLVRSSPGPEK